MAVDVKQPAGYRKAWNGAHRPPKVDREQALHALIYQMRTRAKGLRDPETNGGKADEETADMLKAFADDLAKIVVLGRVDDAN